MPDIEYWSKLLQKERRPRQAARDLEDLARRDRHKERDLFARYVELANAGARAIGFKDVGACGARATTCPRLTSRR